MKTNPLISIVMAAFNAEKFIRNSIESVIAQSYCNWELIIVNDGSTDNTEKIVNEFNDPRINYYKQSNQGVSLARNLGLGKMTGELFCFLDADDIFPPDSLLSRLNIFRKQDEIQFVDGTLIVKDQFLNKILRISKKSFTGEPLFQLARLNESCFSGNTWMIKRRNEIKYQFLNSLTHCEDLIFYFNYCGNGLYMFTENPILIYRQGHQSAMKNLLGLEQGYEYFYQIVKKDKRIPDSIKRYLKLRIIRIMVLSYVRSLKIFSAIKFIFRFAF